MSRIGKNNMDKVVRALEAAGRRVIDTEEVASPRLIRRFDAAKAALAARNAGQRVHTRRLYHGTSPEAARLIAVDGFRIDRTSSARTGAFGAGINLTPDVAHTLLYTRGRATACIVVCDVAISRMHVNVSRNPDDGRAITSVPDHVHPKPGFDAMYGAGGKIVVVPCSARVLPRWLIFHEGQ